MNNNLSVLIDNFKSFVSNKINNINLTSSKVYCYWCDKDELKKIAQFNQNSYSYLSCFFSSKIDNIVNLVDGYIFIFLKNPKILYGFVKVENIIIPNITEKNYLEDDDDEYIENIKNNLSIMIDKIEYNQIISKYKFVEIPKMFLIKFKYLYQFEYEIGIKKFNDYILSINLNKTENITHIDKFEYPKKIQNKEMIKCWDKNFYSNLLKYTMYLYEQNSNLNSNSNFNSINYNISNSDISTDSYTTEFTKQIQFCIPILWNGCCEIKSLIHSNKFNKKTIQNHYTSCTSCEITDNNDIFVNMDSKKIIVININDEHDIKLFDLIISKYKNVSKLNYVNEITKLHLEKGKVNIICCSKSKNIYSKCLFVIE